MKVKKTSIICVALLSFAIQLRAQTDSTATDSSMNKTSIAEESAPISEHVEMTSLKPPLNIIKINIFGILLKNYQLQYERVITRKISFAVAFRTMPLSGLPFQSTIFKAIDDPETEDKIKNFKIGNMAITPEIRFYLSKKGFGRGFYIAPFYRYTKITTNNVTGSYDTDGGGEGSILLSGKVTASSGGLLLGVQKAIGKHVCLDWWLLGPQYGSSTATISGTPSSPLSEDEQKSLRSNLEDINISGVTATSTVTANSAALQLKGPWAGLRIGLNIGIRF